MVGVVLNLAVWFGMHVLLADAAGFNWFAVLVGLGSFIAIQWGGVSIMAVILFAGGLGMLNGIFIN